ncbi:MAG: O-methyltransferase [Thermoleophilaceae bacterium]
MPILAEHVADYLAGLKPEPDPLLAEMEALAERERVPIVQWDTGCLLAALARVLDPFVLEVGTAIGYSTLLIARELDRGRVVTIERDPARASQARDFLERGGVTQPVQLIEDDPLTAIETLEGPFGMLFIDASKDESLDYLEAAEGILTERALLVVDNLLMSGEVAGEPEGDTARWTRESLFAAREFNAFLAASEQWVGATLPVGDGIAIAGRRL